MDEIDMLKMEWLSYLLQNSPWAYINMNCGRLRRWIGREWMDVKKKELQAAVLIQDRK